MESQEFRSTTSAPQGAAGRVVAVHRQTRRGLLQAVAFVGAAAIAVVIPHDTGVWLPLHLFVLGGLLSAICATTQMLAVTWSASRATTDRVATAQRWCLAAGTVLVCVGREADLDRLVEVGGAAVVAAVVAMVPILLGIRRGAVTPRFAPAIDAYVAAMVLGVVGTAVGIIAATGRAPSRWIQLREAHLTINVFGFVGLVIAGTLPYFSATLARSKMSPRATPRVVRSIVAALVTSTIVASAGRWAGNVTATVIGLVTYAVGLLAVAAILPIYRRRQIEWAGPRLLHLMAGIAWWSASAAILAGVVGTGGGSHRVTAERHVLTALIVGGFAQILVGSLAYLGPVLRGGGHEALTAGFAITRSWVSLAAGNVAALGALFDVRRVLVGAVAVWVLDVGLRGLRLFDTRVSAAAA